MEIQRHPNGHLEVTLDAQDIEIQKQEIDGLEYVLRNWKDKSEEAKSCSVSLLCEASATGDLKPLVEDKVGELNKAFGIAVDLKKVDESSGTKIDPELNQKKSHLKDLITLAVVDGQFDEEEQKMIATIGDQLGFSESQIESIYNESILIPHQIESVVPDNEEEKMEQLVNLCRLILADGRIDDWESVLIFPFAVRMGFDPGDVSQLLKDMKEDEKTQ